MISIPSNRMEKRRMQKAVAVMTVLGILIVIAFIISMNTGYVRLSPAQVWNTFWGAGTERQELILFDFRLPRIVLSLLIGAGLAVSGCILQGISRNALAEPGILGINAGAGLAVVLYISFLPISTAGSIFMLPLFAFVGAGLTAALIYILSYTRQGGLSPTRLLVVGIAVAAGISSAMLVFTIRLDPMQYQFVSLWLAGSIWGSNWSFVLALLPWLLILLPLVIFKARVLNVLALGEHTASGLGAHVDRQRLVLLAIAVGLAGSSVAVGGGIAFVGLIGPHLARRIVGSQHQYVLPVSAMMGALLLIVADTLARFVLQPAEIPTGIVTAIIGAPYFLFLLAKSKS